MFTLIYLCKVDDAIKARLEETMLFVHLISCCEQVWCLCVEASSYQMVSIIGRFCVHIVHIIRFLTFGENCHSVSPFRVNPIKHKIQQDYRKLTCTLDCLVFSKIISCATFVQAYHCKITEKILMFYRIGSSSHF